MTLFFVADLHIGHLAMAKRRGFGDDSDGLRRHDETLVKRWNTKVGPRDEVWLLGDVAMKGVKHVASYLSELRGRIHLVRGNHDPNCIVNFCRDIGWMIEPPLLTLKVPTDAGIKRVVLCHYPLLTWDRAHYGVHHYHGHAHGNLRGPKTTRLDVGVDCWDLAPVSFDEVEVVLSTRTFAGVDHHDPQKLQ